MVAEPSVAYKVRPEEMLLPFNIEELVSRQVLDAVFVMASAKKNFNRDSVFTRPEVVDFILDLVGYTEDKPLWTQTILEPSFGGGEFLQAIIRRLLGAWRAQYGTRKPLDVSMLTRAIRAVELHQDTFSATRCDVIDTLQAYGFSDAEATMLADQWLNQGDFLLKPFEVVFDYVVGNPPYVRQELIPSALYGEYRSRFATFYDRADIYVLFIERALTLLKRGGIFGFICSDRWMKNKYGGPLRGFIAKGYHLKFHIDMVDTDAFSSKVTVYPAITVIAREVGATTRIAVRPEITRFALQKITTALMAKNVPVDQPVYEIGNVTNGTTPWVIDRAHRIRLINRLEQEYPLLEEAGCKVGIGVATGADKIFIGSDEALDVEADCKLPLILHEDIKTGKIVWSGHWVINPFASDEGLVDLKTRPKLAAYLRKHQDVLCTRHCAKKVTDKWYRTIDRIYPALVKQEKLLIPDINGSMRVVYDKGEYYPHHNLYYIISADWDLLALQAVLQSDLFAFLMRSFSTQMRGGCIRLQAQYLRRLHLPLWNDVPNKLKKALLQATAKQDTESRNATVSELYSLTEDEIITIMTFTKGTKPCQSS
ncbi:MAG: Eco57I restriction-modification methylase domain-containing protein [bacterium]